MTEERIETIKTNEMELKSFYMMYLVYIHEQKRDIPKNGIEFLVDEKVCLMRIEIDKSITVIGPALKECFSTLKEFKESIYFDIIVEEMCSVYPTLTYDYASLINMGNQTYQDILCNANGFKQKQFDSILEMYTQFECVFKTNYGGWLKMELDAVSGKLKLITEYSEYDGDVTDIVFETTNEYANSVSYDDLENRIETLEKDGDGWVINGLYYNSIQDFMSGNHLFDNIEFDF